MLFRSSTTVTRDRRYAVISIGYLDVRNWLAGADLPNIPAKPPEAVSEVSTMTSIPDGGTLLIGVRPIPGDPANRVGLLLIRPQVMPPDTEARAAIYRMSHGRSPNPFGLP